MGGSPASFTRQFSGRSHRWMVTRSGRLDRQDPAYRSTHRHHVRQGCESCRPTTIRCADAFELVELHWISNGQQLGIKAQSARRSPNAHGDAIAEVSAETCRDLHADHSGFVQITLIRCECRRLISPEAKGFGVDEERVFTNIRIQRLAVRGATFRESAIGIHHPTMLRFPR